MNKIVATPLANTWEDSLEYLQKMIKLGVPESLINRPGLNIIKTYRFLQKIKPELDKLIRANNTTVSIKTNPELIAGLILLGIKPTYNLYVNPNFLQSRIKKAATVYTISFRILFELEYFNHQTPNEDYPFLQASPENTCYTPSERHRHVNQTPALVQSFCESNITRIKAFLSFNQQLLAKIQQLKEPTQKKARALYLTGRISDTAPPPFVDQNGPFLSDKETCSIGSIIALFIQNNLFDLTQKCVEVLKGLNMHTDSKANEINIIIDAYIKTDKHLDAISLILYLKSIDQNPTNEFAAEAAIWCIQEGKIDLAKKMISAMPGTFDATYNKQLFKIATRCLNHNQLELVDYVMIKVHCREFSDKFTCLFIQLFKSILKKAKNMGKHDLAQKWIEQLIEKHLTQKNDNVATQLITLLDRNDKHFNERLFRLIPIYINREDNDNQNLAQGLFNELVIPTEHADTDIHNPKLLRFKTEFENFIQLLIDTNKTQISQKWVVQVAIHYIRSKNYHFAEMIYIGLKPNDENYHKNVTAIVKALIDQQQYKKATHVFLTMNHAANFWSLDPTDLFDYDMVSIVVDLYESNLLQFAISISQFIPDSAKMIAAFKLFEKDLVDKATIVSRQIKNKWSLEYLQETLENAQSKHAPLVAELLEREAKRRRLDSVF